MEENRFIKLDNAGNLYPALVSKKWASMFRASLRLKKTVVPSLLQEAVDICLPRFPMFKVILRKGFFWHYFEKNEKPFAIQEETQYPCKPVDYTENNGYMFRVLYYKKRISVEFFHALTDGTGALCFLNTLVSEYLRLQGHQIAYDFGALNPLDPPKPEEMEDSFTTIPLPHRTSLPVGKDKGKAYTLPLHKCQPHTLHLTCAVMPVDKLLTLARSHNVTIMELIGSIMLYAIYQEAKTKPLKQQRPIRITFPINLRSHFKSNTLRNFSTFVNPWIDPRLGEYTFEDIARQVHTYMLHHNDKKLLCVNVASNLQTERNLFIRLCPIWVKNIIMKVIHKVAGEYIISTVLSNLGKVTFPTGCAEHIERIEFMLGAPVKPMCQATMVSNGNSLQLVFSDNVKEKFLQREVLRFLAKEGIPITVESNFDMKGEMVDV